MTVAEMSRQDTYVKAMIVAHLAHKGQTRRDGRTPYIHHPMAIAKDVEALGDDVMAIALLHDVVEDSDLTIAQLDVLGFPLNILNAVEAITKREGEAYEDYIARVKADPLATVVKIADIKHNMPTATEKAKGKYEWALKELGT